MSTCKYLANCAAILVIWTCGGVSAQAGPLFTRGDANGDQTVNIADASFLLDSLFAGGSEPGCLDAADSNDDGRLDVSDAIYLLRFLFGGGTVPPPPSPGGRCEGPDPTADELDCGGGLNSSRDLPTAELIAVLAPAPGVRQRSRIPVPEVSLGVFQVKEGVSFALLVIAHANATSRRPITLVDPEDRAQGNPETLRVVADKDLGTPAEGGVAAGTNLAPWFLRDLDSWSDPIYLVEHAALRIAGDGPLAPAPGTYRFTLEVTDEGCSVSESTVFTLDVAPSSAPDVFGWIEADQEVKLAPLAHDEGSGSPRVSTEQSFLVVIEASPNGRHPGESPDPLTLEITAGRSPEGGRVITERFERDASAPARWTLWVEPGDDVFPPGNTALAVSVGTGRPEAQSRTPMVIEVGISHATDIQPIWDQNCSGCHEGPNANRGLVLVAPGEPPEKLWRNIVNVFAAEPVVTSSAPFLIRPYFPEESYLYHKLRGTHLEADVGGTGQRMPVGGPPFLDDGAMHAIRSWIIQGAGKD